MTRIAGRVHLTPRDPESWLGQMAGLLPRIHAAAIDAPAYDRRPVASWIGAAELQPPPWASRPDVWQRAISATAGEPAPFNPCFIHSDYQHFNLLWFRERLTGIVDWVFASAGPPDADVGHCRLNLALLFSADWAERFRLAYESEAGRKVDPWWDLAELLDYSPEWQSFIPIQVGHHASVDVAGMTGRVEDLIEATLKRL